jgi:hypothetical protein
MSENKYVMATIKIPMEISDNDSYEPLSEYMQMTFEYIDNLPNKSESDYSNEFIKNKISELLNSSTKNRIEIEEENKIIVRHDEIKQQESSYKKNITFRNKNSSASRYTRRV